MKDGRPRKTSTHRYRLPSEDDEALRSLHHEAREFVTKDLLDFIGLLYLDTDADRVNG